MPSFYINETLQHNILELSTLDSPFSEQEVWETISELPSDKAPGPDGFTGRFYKVCWSTIKDDIMAALAAIWSREFDHFSKLTRHILQWFQKQVELIRLRTFVQ